MARVGGGSSGGYGGIGGGSAGGGSKGGSSGSGKRLIDKKRDDKRGDTAEESRDGTQKGIEAKKRSSDSSRGKVPINKGDKSLPVAKAIGAPTKAADSGSDKGMVFPKLNTGAPSGNTPSGGMKKVEPPPTTSGSGKMLVPPPQPTMELVKPGGKKHAQGLPPWILIAAGVGLLVVLSIVAFVVIQNNLGTNAPKKGPPKNPGNIHDTSMLQLRSDAAGAAFTS